MVNNSTNINKRTTTSIHWTQKRHMTLEIQEMDWDRQKTWRCYTVWHTLHTSKMNLEGSFNLQDYPHKRSGLLTKSYSGLPSYLRKSMKTIYYSNCKDDWLFAIYCQVDTFLKNNMPKRIILQKKMNHRRIQGGGMPPFWAKL